MTSMWRAQWEWLWANTKTTVLTALIEEEGAGDLPRCVLCDLGYAHGYSKPITERSQVLDETRLPARSFFWLDVPRVSVVHCDVGHLLLLPTRNIRLAHAGRWAGEDGSRPCEVPPCGQIDLTALYLGRWLLTGEKPFNGRRNCRVRVLPAKWSAVEFFWCVYFLRNQRLKILRKRTWESAPTQRQSYVCPKYFSDQDLEEKRTQPPNPNQLGGPLCAHSKANSSYPQRRTPTRGSPHKTRDDPRVEICVCHLCPCVLTQMFLCPLASVVTVKSSYLFSHVFSLCYNKLFCTKKGK